MDLRLAIGHGLSATLRTCAARIEPAKSERGLAGVVFAVWVSC
jgi:hypothetical protein